MVKPILRIQHVVELPDIDSQIATARDNDKRIHIYLVANKSGMVYKRNGLNESWDKLDQADRSWFRNLLGNSNTAKVPRYSTSNLGNLN